jgi:hypothetical protein
MKRFIGTITTAFCLLFFGLVAQAGAVEPTYGHTHIYHHRHTSTDPPLAPTAAPEIDPGIASGAIGLLTCGLLMLTAKQRKR